MEVQEITKSLESFIVQIVDERIAKAQISVMRFACVPAAAHRYGRTQKAIRRLIEKGVIPTVHLADDSKLQMDVQVVDGLYLPCE